MDSQPSPFNDAFASISFPSFLDHAFTIDPTATTSLNLRTNPSDLDFLSLPVTLPDIDTSFPPTFPIRPALSTRSPVTPDAGPDTSSTSNKPDDENGSQSDSADPVAQESSEESTFSDEPITVSSRPSPSPIVPQTQSRRQSPGHLTVGVSKSLKKNSKRSCSTRNNSIPLITPHSSQSTATNNDDTPEIISLQPLEQRPNISHTRRCRAKVNNSFEKLLHVLPSPPTGVEIKHKAQIIAYAIDTYRTIRSTNAHLEMQLALSSPHELYRWVRSVMSTSVSLTDALKPFMALICLTKNWKYAELWAPRETDDDSASLCYVTGALPPTVEGDELHRLKDYRFNSRRFVFKPRCGVPGRVFLTKSPEWLPLLTDPVAFPRAPHAVHNNVQVTFAVPVIVNGCVQMIVEFYDTERRDYDADTLNTANEIAVLFGKAFTARRT